MNRYNLEHEYIDLKLPDGPGATRSRAMNVTKYLVMRTAGAEYDIICYPQVAYSGIEAARDACNSELRAGSNAYIVDGQGRCQDAGGCCANPRWPFPKYMRERIAALCA